MLQTDGNKSGLSDARLAAVRTAAQIIVDDGGLGDVIIHSAEPGNHLMDGDSRDCFCKPLCVPATYLVRMTDFEIMRLIAIHEL